MELWFYSPVNPLGSYPAWSVYLTTLFLGRHGALRLTSTCAHSAARNWRMSFLNQRKGDNDCRKYFMINLHKNVAGPNGDPVSNLLITGQMHIRLSHQGQHFLEQVWSLNVPIFTVTSAKHRICSSKVNTLFCILFKLVTTVYIFVNDSGYIKSIHKHRKEVKLLHPVPFPPTL